MVKKYKPINSLESPRFAEVKTFMRLPYVKTTEDIDYAVVGVPFDTGVTYRTGQRFGPNAIRDISSLVKPYNIPQDVNVAEELSGVDYGDVPVNPGYILDSYPLKLCPHQYGIHLLYPENLHNAVHSNRVPTGSFSQVPIEKTMSFPSLNQVGRTPI